MTHTIHRFGPLHLHQNTLIMPHSEHGIQGHYQVHHHHGIGRLVIAGDPDLWEELIGAISADYIAAAFTEPLEQD